MTINAAGDVTPDDIYVEADSVGHFKLFLSSKIEPDAPRPIIFTLEDIDAGNKDSYETMFVSRRKK